MTLNEFKCWLEGFEESFKSSPTQKQWAKVKERIDGIAAEAVVWPQQVVIEKHVPYRPWWPNWYQGQTWCPSSGSYNRMSAGQITAGYATSAAEIGRAEGARLTA